MAPSTAPAEPATRRVGPATRDAFFLWASLVIVVVLAYGFSFTVGDNLVHPNYPRPWIVYAHGVVCVGWLLVLLMQVALVRSRRVDMHRSLGRWGLGLGVLVPLTGLATAVAMARLRLAHGDPDAAVSFPIPVNDALAFSVCFGLALAWRRRPEFHRRLIYLSGCVLTAPGFGRIPALDHGEWFYAGVDAMILAGIAHDGWRDRAVHPVFRYGFTFIVLAQLATAWFRWTPQWLAWSSELFR